MTVYDSLLWYTLVYDSVKFRRWRDWWPLRLSHNCVHLVRQNFSKPYRASIDHESEPTTISLSPKPTYNPKNPYLTLILSFFTYLGLVEPQAMRPFAQVETMISSFWGRSRPSLAEALMVFQGAFQIVPLPDH